MTSGRHLMVIQIEKFHSVFKEKNYNVSNLPLKVKNIFIGGQDNTFFGTTLEYNIFVTLGQ